MNNIKPITGNGKDDADIVHGISKEAANVVSPEKVPKGKTSKMPPAKKWDGDTQEMLNVGYVKMPGFTLNLNDRSTLFEDGYDNNVKRALPKFALKSTTVNDEFKLTPNQSARNTLSEQLKVSLLDMLRLTTYGTTFNWQVLIASAGLHHGNQLIRVQDGTPPSS